MAKAIVNALGEWVEAVNNLLRPSFMLWDFGRGQTVWPVVAGEGYKTSSIIFIAKNPPGDVAQIWPVEIELIDLLPAPSAFVAKIHEKFHDQAVHVPVGQMIPKGTPLPEVMK
jgi:hypothetical protein